MATTGSYYLDAPNFLNATQVFTDSQLTTCAPDGWYSDGDRYRQLQNCILLPSVNCQNCPTSIFVSGVGLTCDEYCSATETLINNEIIGLDYSAFAEGDSITLADGFYAYSSSQGSTTSIDDTLYKIMEVTNNVATNISQCSNTSCIDL